MTTASEHNGCGGSQRIVVYGLWHLGCVTAACLAEAGFAVTGLDLDQERIAELAAGQPPVAEQGLTELIRDGLAAGRLSFRTDPRVLADAEILWVTFDTPVDQYDQADVAWVQRQLSHVRPFVRRGSLVVVSSQVPVGFTRALAQAWRPDDPTLEFACVPENLRLGRALEIFRRPERVVVGLGEAVHRCRLERVFAAFTSRIEWMSIESAEMSKHALNSFLALSVAYTNEVARIAERVGANAADIERALRTDSRVGAHAYVAAGPPIAGGTLARDVAYLRSLGEGQAVKTPVADAILMSNQLHQEWARDKVGTLIQHTDHPRVSVLGLAYKVGTNTLRRSASVELCNWLLRRGVSVSAYDPAVTSLPAGLAGVALAPTAPDALEGADVAVVATGWPEFRSLTGATFVDRMRTPTIVDQAGILEELAGDDRLTYMRVGRPGTRPVPRTS